jgi:hypothetical protein
MKKVISLIICFAMLAALGIPTYAAEQTEVIYSQEIVLEDGTTIRDEIIVTSNARSTDKTATRKKTLTLADVVIGIIAFRATFRYDGSTVYVVSKSVTQTDTYDGWSYQQNSFSSSGGTVTLEGELTKLLFLNTSFSMSLTCDKNGNLST